jgi:septum formation protein
MPPERLILASASPRRRELLARLGIAFDVITADIPELETLTPEHPTPAVLAQENARRKALAVAALHPGRPVLGADTVVALGQRLFGKPATPGHAREFLRALSGQTHEVITGCALIDTQGAMEIFHEVTRVTFLPLSDDVITRYLGEVDVLDKAGAYALQERSEWIIEKVEGSRTNVIGLPIERLGQALGR